MNIFLIGKELDHRESNRPRAEQRPFWPMEVSILWSNRIQSKYSEASIRVYVFMVIILIATEYFPFVSCVYSSLICILLLLHY